MVSSWYDPFCPKILGILGKTKLPRTIASRSIILKMWPKKPDEKAEDFAYAVSSPQLILVSWIVLLILRPLAS